jgi:hypothetical protein
MYALCYRVIQLHRYSEPSDQSFLAPGAAQKYNEIIGLLLQPTSFSFLSACLYTQKEKIVVCITKQRKNREGPSVMPAKWNSIAGRYWRPAAPWRVSRPSIWGVHILWELHAFFFLCVCGGGLLLLTGARVDSCGGRSCMCVCIDLSPI